MPPLVPPSNVEIPRPPSNVELEIPRPPSNVEMQGLPLPDPKDLRNSSGTSGIEFFATERILLPSAWDGELAGKESMIFVFYWGFSVVRSVKI